MEIETHKISREERLEQEKKIRKALLNGNVIIDRNGHRIDKYYYSPEDSEFNPVCLIDTVFVEDDGIFKKYVIKSLLGKKNLVDNVAYHLSVRLRGI